MQARELGYYFVGNRNHQEFCFEKEHAQIIVLEASLLEMWKEWVKANWETNYQGVVNFLKKKLRAEPKD